MPNNFHYAAYSYLDEWMATDRGFHRILSPESGVPASDKEGAKCLTDIATTYGVIRTLRKIEPPETERLRTAYVSLAKTIDLTEADVVEKVDDLAKQLREAYGGEKTPLSAASKFLWIKFRSPVIIYDAKAEDWLAKRFGSASPDYSSYCERWREKYHEVDQEIKLACKDLIGVKKFTLACEEPDESISEWASSQWFRERVFDHYMLNAETFERLTRDH